ncbi:phosphatase domain-containing protein [Archangium lansingense]|uniref:Protein-tyrosine phosphatase family protein n=1 Tax=Archangium lansingense TaxID=2995310 RepID=A0ABT4AL31_9BACT|nr:protein-tyrosine phosphatase family protein [Archangium lansinium]MCY1082403.1 protein-tyrosine phosphatase family protein [Archangium lansinium]
MRTGFLLMACGSACLLLAFAQGSSGAWALAWLGGSFLGVGGAYLGRGTRLLGKREDGSQAWGPVLLLLPYFLFTWTVWHVRRALSQERCFHEVAPGLLLGRRPFAHELPPEVSLIVDLTSEFAEPREVRTRARYLCSPVLDTCALNEDSLLSVVSAVLAEPGPVYVHCANGHGRSSTVAAAVLLARGHSPDVHGAEQHLRRARRGVKLHPEQREVLVRTAPRLRELGAGRPTSSAPPASSPAPASAR